MIIRFEEMFVVDKNRFRNRFISRIILLERDIIGVGYSSLFNFQLFFIIFRNVIFSS